MHFILQVQELTIIGRKIQQSKWEGKIPFNRKNPDRTGLSEVQHLQDESDAWLVVTVDWGKDTSSR